MEWLPGAEWVEDWIAYVFEVRFFEMEVTEVLSKRLAPDDFIMPSKICQFPPLMDMAPSIAMQTIVSKPWIWLRFCA